MANERRLRLLCLDGGGVRGLASLYILRQLLGPLGSPKPCEFFDMICGTSTGGLIAIMLGRLEMSIDTCIAAFIQMMDGIFVRRRFLPFGLISGRVSARFDTKRLKQNIQTVIEMAGLRVDTPMRRSQPSACKTFVVAMTAESKGEVIFTDYDLAAEPSSFFREVKIWEAARATSAATTFFDPISIENDGITRTFWDGALKANNPISRLWVAAQEQFGKPLEPQIRCLLSIGTGLPPLRAFGMGLRDVGNSIVKIATETEDTALHFRMTHTELAERHGYFRFNPPDMSEIELEDVDRRGIINDRAHNYGELPDVRQDMERFRRAVGSEQIPAIEHIRESLPIKPKVFYDLTHGPNHIKPGDSYWRHLTLDSYRIYERIYLACSRKSSLVSFEDFLTQFNSSYPPRQALKETWMRLQPKSPHGANGSLYPKPLVMAVLYMLHIESKLSLSALERPHDGLGAVGIDETQRETLKRFTKWIPCQCNPNRRQCAREWNFVNEIGLSREVGQHSDNPECEVLKLFGKGKGFPRAKYLQCLRDMRNDKWRDAK